MSSVIECDWVKSQGEKMIITLC